MMGQIRKYQEANRNRLLLQTNWEKLRFVCIDSESTGFDPNRDSLISLAGVGVCEGEICLYDTFSVVVPVAFNTSSVTVHGITREAAAEGVEEPEALAQFLDWLEDGIIVGHHVQHDLTLLNVALQRHFNISLRNVAVDTMEAFMMVVGQGGFSKVDLEGRYSLDALCELFNITPHDRHTAMGDAFLTAQILLRVLKEGGKRQMWNLDDLHAWYSDQVFPYAEG